MRVCISGSVCSFRLGALLFSCRPHAPSRRGPCCLRPHPLLRKPMTQLSPSAVALVPTASWASTATPVSALCRRRCRQVCSRQTSWPCPALRGLPSSQEAILCAQAPVPGPCTPSRGCPLERAGTRVFREARARVTMNTLVRDFNVAVSRVDDRDIAVFNSFHDIAEGSLLRALLQISLQSLSAPRPSFKSAELLRKQARGNKTFPLVGLFGLGAAGGRPRSGYCNSNARKRCFPASHVTTP